MKYFVALLAVMLFAAMTYPTQSVSKVIAESNRAIPLVTTAATTTPPVWQPGRCNFVEMNRPVTDRGWAVEMNQPIL
jgi:hypothetical protein